MGVQVLAPGKKVAIDDGILGLKVTPTPSKPYTLHPQPYTLHPKPQNLKPKT